MALNLSAASLHPKLSNPSFFIRKHDNLLKFNNSSNSTSSSCRKSSRSEGTETRVTEEDSPASFSGSSSSTRTQLDLLEQLTSTSSSVDDYKSDGSSGKLTIREQLAQLVGDGDDDFSIPLGKNLKKVSDKFLTISQRRNIRRQSYLNEVSRRNDSVFFATIGAFVILPPLVILGIAIATGYVQLFP
ncbi:Myosin-G heavy chain-like protein [Quillaja saponaria]|uniref:Myosin-G heavy chain-like protein n=1 Tax=Quillaja saponaria TaxID=32244 RepID=A0AAD7PRQ4_QUISA|nr:Myosin-G heavy chain-like protein [Quillaja saponaria]